MPIARYMHLFIFYIFHVLDLQKLKKEFSIKRILVLFYDANRLFSYL